MELEQFWEIVRESRKRVDSAAANGNMRRQAVDLERQLRRLTPDEVIAFRDHLANLFAREFRWDLWGAAYVIADGCSDDGFADFRGWLISMGPRVYEDALADPESLTGPATDPSVEDVFFEEFRHIPARVFEQKLGREIAPYRGKHPRSPSGRRWTEDELRSRLPGLWSRFGEE